MRFTMKVMLMIALLACTSLSFSKPTPVANKLNDIVDRHLSGFNGISVGGSFDVQITQGLVESVKVEAPADVMDRIITEVDGGVLKIYNKNDKWNWGNWWGNHKRIIVYVTAKELNAITVSGSGDVSFKNGISANSLKLHVSGSGDVNGMVNVKTLESNISGSGDIKLSGHAENSTVSVSGSGDFTARDLITVNSAIRISGSGDAVINASEKIDATVHGSGDVRYTGAAKSVSSSKTGSGDVSRL